MSIFHVRREMEFCRLILYGLIIFQVQPDVLSLGKLDSLPIFCLCLCLL